MPLPPWTDNPFGKIISRDIVIAGDDKARPLQTVKKSSCRPKLPRSGSLSEISAHDNQARLDIGEALVKSGKQLRMGPAKV